MTREYERGRLQGQRDAEARIRTGVIAEQQRVGDINFCKDCADWAVAVIDAAAQQRVKHGHDCRCTPCRTEYAAAPQGGA